jgi:predicted N-acetyltransferase YhbS
MVTIRAEISADIIAREALLDRAFGRVRHRKTSQRIRDGRLPAEGLAFTALNKSGRVIGTLRMWNVVAGSAGPALLLGPLAVDVRYQRRGVGRELMSHALNMAKVLGHASVLLVGDKPYYSRFGFTRDLVADLHLPGPVDRDRFLGIELAPGALDGAEGLVMASGSLAPNTDDRGPAISSSWRVSPLRKNAAASPGLAAHPA